MKLVYKTRGDSTPQGKPRVYFTGHPKDFEPYFGEIAEDILRSQNCAIYYDAEPEADYDRDALLHELEQMQLFVIPVTGRFLFQRSRALDVEFPFAMARHIPVLPLMQESGLEEKFNQICGDLQLLDKHGKDNTALPFEEKLEKFLTSVLVGDELAEKVRAAFDAYVFLSYRKKDRRYAQELMRLIHKNAFCQDIAIWYDEFLTPGENFNEAIGAALEKCGLFTLAVTPSVVEQGNYVMTVEYPEARRAGKSILPAELVPTDKDVLRASFQGLPPCVDARDEKALSGALLEAARGLAIRENDGSPEHNFFIGLAYLNGIDVEVDRERALSLIKGAAMDELPEATEKLVSMYRSGDGVERDYQEAIRWQERLVAYRKQQFEQSGMEADGLDWTLALWYLGDYREELSLLSEARTSYQEMCRVSKLLADKFGSVSARRALSVSNDKLGNISRAQGRLNEAKEYYLQALDIAKGLYADTLTARAEGDMSVSYANIGKLCEAEGQLTEAKEYYLQALKIDKSLCEKTPTALARENLSSSYIDLGDISQAAGALSEAKEYYLKALEIDKSLCDELPTVQVRRGCSIAYERLGDISKAEGQSAEAKEYYRKAIEITEELCGEAPTAETRRDLAVGYEKLGNISKAEGNLDDAKVYYLRALENDEARCAEAPTIQARRDLAAGYTNLGRVWEAKGHPLDAKLYYLQALELRKELYKEAPTVRARRSLSISYSDLGDTSKAEGLLSEAKELYIMAMDIARELYDLTKMPKDYDRLAILCYNTGLISDKESKKSLFTQAYDIWSYLSDTYPDRLQFSQRKELAGKQLNKLEGSH